MNTTSNIIALINEKLNAAATEQERESLQAVLNALNGKAVYDNTKVVLAIPVKASLAAIQSNHNLECEIKRLMGDENVEEKSFTEADVAQLVIDGNVDLQRTTNNVRLTNDAGHFAVVIDERIYMAFVRFSDRMIPLAAPMFKVVNTLIDSVCMMKREIYDLTSELVESIRYKGDDEQTKED